MSEFDSDEFEDMETTDLFEVPCGLVDWSGQDTDYDAIYYETIYAVSEEWKYGS